MYAQQSVKGSDYEGNGIIQKMSIGYKTAEAIIEDDRIAFIDHIIPSGKVTGINFKIKGLSCQQ